MDQITLLKAQLAAVSGTSSTNGTFSPAQNTTASQTNAEDLLERIKQLEKDNEEKDSELEKIRKDQDDLLELLTDQDLKLNSFKSRLRELGETIDEGDSYNNSESENES